MLRSGNTVLDRDSQVLLDRVILQGLQPTSCTFVSRPNIWRLCYVVFIVLLYRSLLGHDTTLVLNQLMRLHNSSHRVRRGM